MLLLFSNGYISENKLLPTSFLFEEYKDTSGRIRNKLQVIEVLLYLVLIP